MKLKINKWLRYLCVPISLMLIIPICERNRIVSGAADRNVFEGQELICAIDLGDDMTGSHGLETGLSYELMKRFAADNHCSVRIIAHNKNENFLDSLAAGKVDLVITHDEHTPDTDIIRFSCKLDDCSVIAVRNETGLTTLNKVNCWISHMKNSGDFSSIRSRFKGTGNPLKKSELGIKTGRISPYDEIIKRYAAELGWDWRMLAAVVYQESKFSINSRSHRGAQGLMQVMPSTAARYGISDLVDPENNIKAGTKHLKMLQNIWKKRDLEPAEMIRFTLASYNAGEGRILESRNYAAEKGYDADRWEEIVKTIPMMREEGLFQGYETIAYIENIEALYKAICNIHPIG